jgi:hypothetical protein
MDYLVLIDIGPVYKPRIRAVETIEAINGDVEISGK